MASIINGEFFLGETWVVEAQAFDADRAPLDLTGGTVRFRMATYEDELVMDLSTPGDGTITSPANGQFEFVISPTQQVSSNVISQHYKYEVKAFTQSNVSSVQVTGRIRVSPSLFSN